MGAALGEAQARAGGKPVLTSAAFAAAYRGKLLSAGNIS
jgi:hypothetical protein